MKCLLHRDHFIVTIIAFALMGFFAVVSVSVSFLNPVAQSFGNLSLTDMYYQIERYGVAPDTSELITIVDMTDLYSRGDLANMFQEINAMEPTAVGADIIFEGVKDDAEGNTALIEAVSALGSKAVFTCKLKDYDAQKQQFTGVIRSFFADSVNVKQGYANLPDNMGGKTIREYTIHQKLNGKQQPSFPFLVAKTIDPDVKASDKLLHIDYGNKVFRVVKAQDLAENFELINNHIVLVGTMHEEQDMHLSPVGKMAGLEIQAYSLQSILDRKMITDAPTWLSLLTAFILCYLFELSLYGMEWFCTKHPSTLFLFLQKSTLLATILISLWLVVVNGLFYELFRQTEVYLDAVLVLALLMMTLLAHKYYSALIKALEANHKNKFLETSLYR